MFWLIKCYNENTMKNAFKIIGIVVLSYIATTVVENLFTRNIRINLSIPNQIILAYVLSFVVFTICFSLLWSLFLRDKNIGASFLKQIKFKKTYFILVAIFALFYVLASVGRIDRYKNSFSLDAASHFINDSIYENSKYHFRLVYPKGSFFAYAHPEIGFVTRFFIPDGESIGNDKENVGIYIKKNSEDIETEVQKIKDRFSKNGPIDIKEVQFGGQKGYRIIFVSDYSAQKGTKELTYITVKNNMAYELNYFPVAKNISVVDTIASSFEFIQ